MLLTPFAADADNEATQKFVSAYKAEYNDEIPNQFAADAYDGVYILAKLIEQEKITGDMDAKEICEKLSAAISSESFSYNGLTGDNMTWAATGEVSKNPKAVIIKDGAYSALD